MSYLNETHDPALQSWVDSANQPDNGFPIQNLPFAVFRPAGGTQDFHPGVAIGDQVLDLAALAAAQVFTGKAAEALGACKSTTLNKLMSLGQPYWSALRLELSRALRSGSALQATLEPLLSNIKDVELGMPARIGDYTDFYISEHHATAVGKQFRPDNPLLPNYKWVPIGYHGRASSINVSGQSFPRPVGQTRPATEGGTPGFGPCQRLDYELELGIFVGQGNTQGERINLDEAEAHVFGLCILNDWSARDLQAWEYQPLGPFLAKNFASTISPWVVTLEALAPFRIAFERNPNDPQPLPYLSSAENQASGAFDIGLQVFLSTQASRAQQTGPALLSESNFKDAYWNIAQLLAHHTVNGCNLQAGDLLGTGTLSGPGKGKEGSLLELNNGGKQPVKLPWGEERSFLQDHDEVILRAACRKPGYPTISLGQSAGTVLPAKI
ncbi:fumarylacetoacetase [Pollutimonas harenae]|uniref:fumarylacetoacetase n=1 Tax=Pollutimonas harenae TaxID=657015 RepID=A0A853H3T8_9BURK|nr:fumarylacetoacetase [Pollutimonas harenae]NYT86892.1 fumarylacetoacetase [Pollutimonas harenae]TEA69393.1 fumarylacetoacetase [Pollutimonas harenae]